MPILQRLAVSLIAVLDMEPETQLDNLGARIYAISTLWPDVDLGLLNGTVVELLATDYDRLNQWYLLSQQVEQYHMLMERTFNDFQQLKKEVNDA